MIHVVFNHEPVILTEDAFSGLEKEIDTFNLPPDISDGFDYKKWKWNQSREFCLQDICMGTTVDYYHRGSSIDCLEVWIPDLFLVGASGLIDPFWALLVDKIKINFIYFNQYIKTQLVWGTTLEQIIADPVAVSKRIGNRIIVATDRQNKAVVKTIYDSCDEFEQRLRQEAKMIRSKKKKKRNVSKKTTTTSTTAPTIKKCESTPDMVRCTLDDIGYWDKLNSMSEEERSYYGWERDPQ